MRAKASNTVAPPPAKTSDAPIDSFAKSGTVVSAGPVTSNNPIDRFADNGTVPSGPVGIWDWLSADGDKLMAAYKRGVTPKLEDFANQTMQGVILQVPGHLLGSRLLAFLNDRWGEMLTGEHDARNMSYENRFGAATADGHVPGRNFLPAVGKENHPMIASLAPSHLDPKGPMTMQLDYNVEGEPWLDRRPIDEMRQIPGTDWYLGQMRLRTFGDSRMKLLWFVMRAK